MDLCSVITEYGKNTIEFVSSFLCKDEITYLVGPWEMRQLFER